MPTYVLNQSAQANGDHEVHNLASNLGCLPQPANQIPLGFHATCQGAVTMAKTRYVGARINGCYYCCNPCHTS